MVHISQQTSSSSQLLYSLLNPPSPSSTVSLSPDSVFISQHLVRPPKASLKGDFVLERTVSFNKDAFKVQQRL